MNEITRELIGGPLDGLRMKVPPKTVTLQMAIRPSLNTGYISKGILCVREKYVAEYEAYDQYDAGSDTEPDRPPSMRFYARYTGTKKG